MAGLSDQAIRDLKPDERLALIERLWDSLGDRDVPVTQAQSAELDHRLDRLDRDIENGIGWKQLKAERNQRR